MRLLVVSLDLLFIALVVPSYAQKTAQEQGQAEVVVREGEPLRVECLLRVEQRVEWRVEGAGALAPELRGSEAPAPAGGVRAVLVAPAARLHHAGVYTCARGAPAVRVLVLPAAARARAAHAPHGVDTSTPAAAAAAAVAVTTAATEEDDTTYTPYRYEVGYAIVLNCSGSDSPPGITYTWSKNGTLIEKLDELKDRYESLEGGAVLRVKPRTNENDFGDYKCIVGEQTASAWRVHGVPSARMTANVNVVEGQKLKLTCRLVGKPYPPVQWLYSVADSGNETKETVESRLKDREFKFYDDKETGVPNGILEIESAVRGDAGNYTCAPPGGNPGHTVLRVKGMYDALWPFLGICAEVFILCAIILVYEKRRTKPELDDSDTDNHDQKKS